MKKIGVILTLIFLLLGSTGCINQTLNCIREDFSNEDLKIKDVFVIKFQKNKVTKVKTTIEAKASGVYTKHMDTLKDSMEESYTNLKGKKGVQFKSSLKENTIHILLNIHVKKLDKSSLDDLDTINIESSYEEVKKNLQGEGYTCK